MMARHVALAFAALLAGAAVIAEEPVATAGDPLDPAAPSGSVRAFLDAARRADFVSASAYLDLSRIPADERADSGPRLARQLKFVLDRKLWIDLEALSARPEGDLDDGLKPELERLGRIEGPVATEVLLERATGAARGAPGWRFAPDTVVRVPELYGEYGYGWIGERLPAPLLDTTILDVRLIQWLMLLALIGVAWLVGRVGVWFLYALAAPMARRTGTDVDDRVLALLRTPLRFAVALAAFTIGSLAIGLAAPVQQFLNGLAKGLAAVAVTWIAMRLVDVASGVMRERLERTERRAALAVLPLGRRTAKVVLVALAAIGLLQNLGFNVTGIVAGLGVGGLAFALAAQKSIENLFGGVTLVADQPVRVGDYCRFADGKAGVIEEIGLRSTRVRTLDRTLVTVPNSQFSELQLENFSRRDRIRLLAMLGLRYETSPAQLRALLEAIRGVLEAHPRVLGDPLRVRFVAFGPSSLDIEVFAMIDTTDFNEFCAIREELFFRFMEEVEASGSGFAFPSQTLYLARDSGLGGGRAG